MKNTFTILFIIINTISYAQIQKGNDINGEDEHDESGFSISMPNSYTIAIGAPYNDQTPWESGHVRVFLWNGNSWIQKGSDIDGENSHDNSGYSVSMPNSNIVAIGAPFNDGNSSVSGHVRVYKWDGNTWVQKGNDIDGSFGGDYSGYAVSMSDSNTLAIGAPKNDVNGVNSGQVRVLVWNGNNWIQKGNSIYGEAPLDNLGKTISMPDSNTLALGAYDNYGNGTESGHVRVFYWNGNSWMQKGNEIEGDTAYDRLGASVSMPDSNTLAVAAPRSNVNGSNSGQIKIYKWNGVSWTQKGNDIYGESSESYAGSSISMADSNTIIIGAKGNDDNGNNSGQARLYSWNGNSWLQIGQDVNGENNYDFFGQTVSSPNSSVFAVGAPLNDGVNNLDPDIGHVRVYCIPTTQTITQTTCDNYTPPSGNYTWTTSGTYQDTIVNSLGCDSILTINLTVNNSNAGSQSKMVCNSFTWPANNQSYTSSGNYTTTLTNSDGCDSVVTLNLTVNDSSSSTISTVVCDNYTSPSGNYNWTSSGTYMDTIQNAEGCDSLITVNLTVNQSTISSISPIVCDNYTSPSENYTWTTSGTYQDTISNIAGCDSVITIDLNVDSINSDVQNSGDSLIAQDTGATYQWVYCDNNSTPIPGETDQILEVAVSGDYAVSLTKHGCIDTSACYNVIPSGFETAISGENNIIVYPNPNDGLFTIEHSFTERKPFEVTNVNGKVLYSGTLTQKQTKVDLSNFATGIYLLRVEDAIMKLVLK
ncbi:T9SS type A sorting domain-containing protein [Salibacter halophilus]|uniref:T9SS type A sorting domain-containing protein n=1 Tax=Salibacter halophilus TaxID=1803916 RepID=A0A6N6MDE2_9FLAO|nr:T9SS type A sorting domain-containing protein [Salibacter halophilus]KAB1065599.1 T9SS type A sorting domain-containing protein [Salibacter halophilus]